jgi:hypothetical protein
MQFKDEMINRTSHPSSTRRDAVAGVSMRMARPRLRTTATVGRGRSRFCAQKSDNKETEDKTTYATAAKTRRVLDPTYSGSIESVTCC